MGKDAMMVDNREEDELLAEDERLTPDQAARLARQLRASRAELASRRRHPTASVEAPPVRRTSTRQPVVSPQDVMARVVTEVLALVPAADAAALETVAGPGGLTWSAATGSLADDRLRELSHAGLASLVVASGAPFRLDETAPTYPALSQVGVGSVIAVPLHVATVPRWVLTVCADQAGAFDDADVAALVDMAGFAAAAMTHAEAVGAPSDDLADFVNRLLGAAGDNRARADVVDRIRRVVRAGHVEAVFQPIIDLRDRAVVGYEVLSRITSPPPLSTGQWFAEATRAGMGVELEAAAIGAALQHAQRLPDGVFLAVNVSPDMIASPRLAEALAPLPAERVVIELTEHAPVDDYPALKTAIDDLRARGARLAVDDAGAGFASLRHILRLAPDIIKLDITLTHNVDTDPVRQALASSLISFAGEVRARIIAEGIETRWELEALSRLGVELGQGYHLARPGPLP